jgi:Mn-containing catalase
MTISPERREEFAPGLDPDLLALIQATAEVELKEANNPKGTSAPKQDKNPTPAKSPKQTKK